MAVGEVVELDVVADHKTLRRLDDATPAPAQEDKSSAASSSSTAEQAASTDSSKTEASASS